MLDIDSLMKGKENREVDLNDNSVKMVYNALAYKGETNGDLRNFLQYVYNLRAENNFTKKLKSLVQKIKDDEEYRQEYMKMNLHDFDIQYAAHKEGVKSAKLEDAVSFLKLGIELETVAKGTGLPLSQIKELQKQL